MIYLTKSAKARVEKYMKEKVGSIGIYVDVVKSGCHGYSYRVDMINEIKENQTVFDHDGIKIVIDQNDMDLIDEMQLDVKKNGLNEYFVFENPKAESTCGCGTSFNI